MSKIANLTTELREERWPVWMDSDRIRMNSNPDITFYHILIRIRIRIRIFSNTNTKRMVRIRIRMFTQNQLEIIFLKFNLDE